MKIPIKLPRFLATGVLALSLLAATPGLLPTHQAVAGQYDKVVITERWGNKIVEADDLDQSYIDLVKEHVISETKEEYVKGGITAAASEMANTYPKYELIAINGVPWQETEWADLIKSKFMAEDKETGWVAYPLPLRELIFDSRLNGKGLDIDRLVKEGKTADEVRGIMLKDKTTAIIDKKDGSKESTKQTPPASNVDQSKDYQLVLTVGKNNGSEIKDGVSRPVAFDTAPEISNETTMVPLRGVVDKFGADIIWDATSNSVTVKMGDNTVTVQVDSKKATVNGKETTLTVPPVLKNGRVLIPLRFISEGIGLDVNWDNVTNSIIVKQPQKSTNVK